MELSILLNLMINSKKHIDYYCNKFQECKDENKIHYYMGIHDGIYDFCKDNSEGLYELLTEMEDEKSQLIVGTLYRFFENQIFIHGEVIKKIDAEMKSKNVIKND